MNQSEPKLTKNEPKSTKINQMNQNSENPVQEMNQN